jgi:hypothetical protein
MDVGEVIIELEEALGILTGKNSSEMSNLMKNIKDLTFKLMSNLQV